MKILLIRAGAGAPPAAAPRLDPGSPVFASSAPDCVALASAWFPDQGIKVSKAFADPIPSPAPLGLSRLFFALGWAPEGETHEGLKRRVVELAVALVDGAKKKESAAFVGGPLMIRLLGYKLASIGYKGPLLSSARPFHPREYHY